MLARGAACASAGLRHVNRHHSLVCCQASCRRPGPLFQAHLQATRPNVTSQTRCMASFYDSSFRTWANKALTPIVMSSLSDRPTSDQMMLEGTEKIRKQLPIRMARPIVRIHQLPYIAGINPHIQAIHDLYEELFKKVLTVPPIKDRETEQQFIELLETSITRTRPVLRLLAKASKDLYGVIDTSELTSFVDTMLESRLSRRLLVEHHLALHRQHHFPEERRDDTIGVLHLSCHPHEIAKHVFEAAASIARKTYGFAPKLVCVGPDPAPFSYVKRHLEYILLELFKNSIRAVAESTLQKQGGFLEVDEESIPPIELAVFSNPRQTTLKITDYGGGIPSEHVDKIWDYAFTTVPESSEAERQDVAVGIRQPHMKRSMAGEGFGLPMARIYAKFFDGKLSIQSLSRYGTEVFLNLKHVDRSELPNALKPKARTF